MPDTLTSTEALTNRVPATTAPDSRTVQELWDAYRKAWKKFSKAMDATDAAMVRTKPHLPPRPDSLKRELALVGGGTKIADIREWDIRLMVHEGTIKSHEADELRRQLQKWEADCEIIEASHGHTDAQAAQSAAEQDFRAIEAVLATAPVRSDADIIPKLLFVMDQEDLDNEASTAVRGVIRYLKQRKRN
jgi:hypothetical protein